MKVVDLMRDRLIDLLGECRCIEGIGAELIEKQADYLIANGVIVPPVNAGVRLYEIVKMPCHTFVSEFPMTVEPYQIIYRNIMGGHSCIPFENFGKTVFLTREEAEQALRKNN